MENRKNKYLEKIAGINWEKALTLVKTAEAPANGKPGEAGTDAVIGAGILGTGLVSAKNNYHAGNITGRESLYHGTSTENSKNILREGLKPGGRGISQMVDKASGKDITGHNSHVFMTRDQNQAASYAVQVSKLSKAPEEEVVKRMKEGQRAVDVPHHEITKAKSGKFEGANILRANVPTWKKEMGSVVNPEWVHMNRTRPLHYLLNQQRHDYLFKDSVYAREGTVPSKYFQGAANYERNSVNEISQFIKNNPGRFLKGVGGAAAAVGVGGLFLHNAYKNFKGSNTEGQQKQASFIRKVPIDKTLTRRIQNLLKSKAKRLDRLSNYGKYVGGAVGGAVGYKATDSKDFSTGDRILAAGIGGALGAGAGNEIAKRLATKLKHRNLIKTIGRAPGILERLKEIRPLKRPGVQDEYHDLMAKVMKRD